MAGEVRKACFHLGAAATVAGRRDKRYKVAAGTARLSVRPSTVGSACISTRVRSCAGNVPTGVARARGAAHASRMSTTVAATMAAAVATSATVPAASATVPATGATGAGSSQQSHGK